MNARASHCPSNTNHSSGALRHHDAQPSHRADVQQEASRPSVRRSCQTLGALCTTTATNAFACSAQSCEALVGWPSPHRSSKQSRRAQLAQNASAQQAQSCQTFAVIHHSRELPSNLARCELPSNLALCQHASRRLAKAGLGTGSRRCHMPSCIRASTRQTVQSRLVVWSSRRSCQTSGAINRRSHAISEREDARRRALQRE